MNGFMNIPGVDGGSRDSAHVNWFDLSGLGFSVTSGGGAGAATWTFGATASAGDGLPPLMLDSASQKALSSVVFEFDHNAGGAGPQKFLTITLTNARVATTGTTVAQSSGVSMALSFSFAGIAFEITETNPDGTPGTTIDSSFDLLANTGGTVSTQAVTYGLGGSNASVTEPITAFTPQTETATGGKTSFGPASVVIDRFDASALNSVGLAFRGEVLPQAHVLFFSQGAQPFVRLQYDFGNALTSSVSVAGLTSAVSFSADDLHWTSFTQNPDGSQGAGVTAGWSVSRNMAE